MHHTTIFDSSTDIPEIPCSHCGNPHLRRVPRKGFLQDKVFPLFGYYPWECPLCRQKRLLRRRSLHDGAGER